MGWPFCEKHRGSRFILTSPKFAAAIKSKESIDPDDIRYFRFTSKGLGGRNPVDTAFLEQFGFSANNSVVVLENRDLEAKQLNDRLLMQKILKEMQSVCCACLDGVLPRSHATS